MKKAFDDKEKIVRDCWEKWKIVLRCLDNIKLGSDKMYSSLTDNAVVRNEILGITTKAKVYEAVEAGVIVFDGCWRIATEIKKNNRGRNRVCVSDKFLNWMFKKGYHKKDPTEL